MPRPMNKVAYFALAFLTVAGLAWASASCADFHRGPAPLDAASGADASAAPVADLMFETQVYPILQTRCEDCHSAGREAASSKLVLGGYARAGDVRLPTDSSEYQTVFNWISMLAP
jgi:hypothetical protein